MFEAIKRNRPKHRGTYRAESPSQLGGWWFPELEGPDLSTEVVPGERRALALLSHFSVEEIWSADPEVMARVEAVAARLEQEIPAPKSHRAGVTPTYE